jgi:hypothetical protein
MKHTNNLDFDGMAGDGVNRAPNKFAKNYHTGHSNDGRPVNMGRGPTKAGVTGDSVPNPTARSGRITGGTTVHMPSDPDKINMGMKHK